MELDKVISQMEANEGQQKTAAETPAADPVEYTELSAALEKAAGAPEPEGEEADAVAILMKQANELAGTEKEADIAHAALCGQAFADGAIAKFAAYDAQTRQMSTPEPAPANPMSKVAAATEGMPDEEVVKVAANAGYQVTLEKLAADYNAGHDAALQDVHDQASAEFLKGAAEAEILVNVAQQQANQK